MAIAQATDFPQRFRGAAFRALVVLQVRSLLSGYEHERSHVHGFYRCCDREDSHASSHAIVPNFPLQLEILRQRWGRLRRRVVETFRHAVRRREYRRVPCSRALLGGFPPGYICQRCHAEGILNRGADEVQERVQIQNRLRGIADGDGAVARLREWRMGPYESHQTFRSHTNNPSGGIGVRWPRVGNPISNVEIADRLHGDAAQKWYRGKTVVQIRHAFNRRRRRGDFLDQLSRGGPVWA